MQSIKEFLFISVFLFSCSFIQVSTQDQGRSLKETGQKALSFCQSNSMNIDYCVLVDMSIHSGKKRLFLFDFKSNQVIDSALVSHGCGNNPWGSDDSKVNPTFSNINGSHQASLGKFKIGKRGYSNWGIHINYKLHGLDVTNSNAYKRLIVLHSWKEVGDQEVYPNGTPEGWGCPAVSNQFMTKLDKKLKVSDKPVLLWVYNN